MTRTPLAERTFVTLSALFFVAAFSVVPSYAQTQRPRNYGQRALAVRG